MPRIRSLHPGQWTDDQFVVCSFGARLLALGLRNEADDNGIFEWNPIKIKMRLFPADNVEIDELLTELVESGQVIQYAITEKLYGMIRNFTKYQKVKAPGFLHPVPLNHDELPKCFELNKAYSPKVSSEGLGVRLEGLGKGRSDSDNKPSGKPQKRFIPPTLEEVAQYCKQRGKGVDPEQWMNHYTANGWKVGKNGMKDWRASVRTWEKSDINPKPEQHGPRGVPLAN